MDGWRQIAGLFLFACFCWLESAGVAFSQSRSRSPGERIQMGISVDIVPVGSEFSGQEIAVFGTIENANPLARVLNSYAVAVAISGPPQDIVVRRKERVFGIWMNRKAREFANVPSFYAVASNRPLNTVSQRPVLRQLGLGIENIALRLHARSANSLSLQAPEFTSSLRRIRSENGLYSQNGEGVVFLSSNLFRATLSLPSNVPIGRHVVTAYLFRDGALLDRKVGALEVRKIGFEELMYTLAHQYSLWYGLLAVLIALATGWLGSVIFSTNRQ